MTTDLGLGHVAVTTNDLDRLARFYENTLDIRLAAFETSTPPPVNRMGILASATGVVMLAFEVPDADFEIGDGVGRRGPIDHFTFHVATIGELRQLAARLAAAGASSGEISQQGPNHSVLLHDVDRRAINIVCPNPLWERSPTLQITDAERFGRHHRVQPAAAN